MTPIQARREVQTVDQALDNRIDGLTKWPGSHASQIEDQVHLDEGSPERAYWHHGYLSALRDLRALLHGEKAG